MDEVWLYAYNNNKNTSELILNLKDVFFDKELSAWEKIKNIFLSKKIEPVKNGTFTFILSPSQGIIPILSGIILPIETSVFASVSDIDSPILITGFVNSIFEKEE